MLHVWHLLNVLVATISCARYGRACCWYEQVQRDRLMTASPGTVVVSFLHLLASNRGLRAEQNCVESTDSRQWALSTP